MSQAAFSHQYVMRATIFHMQERIQASVTKTMSRVEELSDDPDSAKELFMTLTALHNLNNYLGKLKDEYAQETTHNGKAK